MRENIFCFLLNPLDFFVTNNNNNNTCKNLIKKVLLKETHKGVEEAGQGCEVSLAGRVL